MSRTMLFVQRELAGSLRARWFLAYSAVFLAGGLLLATFGMGDITVYGFRGFAKAFTGLVHLALLFVPLMALFPAAAAIAEDRESGALEYVLAQPVTFGEVYAGKLGGVSLAVLLSMTLGFGAAGAVAVLRGVPPGLVAILYAFVVLLALVFVALGLCFSTIAGSRARAVTFGILVWLVLVALGTLGVMVAFVRWGLPEQLLVTWSFLNPVEAFRMGVVSALDADLSLLGPVGARVAARFGAAGTATLSGLSLAAWVALPGLIGWRLFRAHG
ncbi:MAG: ABC transporter permease [Gemmatimonadota bacterium]|nr:MAG: ABC transporter permease [Gemmatimonadota bacterium]